MQRYVPFPQKELLMPHFCHPVSHTSSAWTRVLRDPQDRFAAIRIRESLGGQIRAAFFAIDSFDVLVISEFPDGVSSSAIALAFSASGDVAHIRTTALLDASHVATSVPLPAET